MSDNNEKKILYVCDNKILLDDYLEIIYPFFKRFYIPFLPYIFICSFILTLLLFHIVNIKLFIFYFLIILLTAMVVVVVLLPMLVKRIYKKNLKGDSIVNKVEFYCDRLRIVTEQATRIVNYSNITQCVETAHFLCFGESGTNNIIVIQKNQCESELLQFIRGTFSHCFVKKIKTKSKLSGNKKLNRKEHIYCLAYILFALTIISLLGTGISILAIQKINDIKNPISISWVAWIWLVIPILFLLFCYRYVRNDTKWRKKIQFGAVAATILFLIGCMSFSSSFINRYHDIYQYQDILNIELSSNGSMKQIIHYDEVTGKKKYEEMQATFSKKDSIRLEQSILSADNWVSLRESLDTMKQFIPEEMIDDEIDNQYISIYNDTLKEYNKVPNENGTYEIYIMIFRANEKTLNIAKITYEYKKDFSR